MNRIASDRGVRALLSQGRDPGERMINMFESIGELAVVSVLLGVTVFAFLYLAYRGARVGRTREESTKTSKGDSQHASAKSA